MVGALLEPRFRRRRMKNENLQAARDDAARSRFTLAAALLLALAIGANATIFAVGSSVD